MAKNFEKKQPVSIMRNTGSDEEATRMRAYELYVHRGMEDGHDVDDWLQAEEELMRRKARSAVA